MNTSRDHRTDSYPNSVRITGLDRTVPRGQATTPFVRSQTMVFAIVGGCLLIGTGTLGLYWSSSRKPAKFAPSTEPGLETVSHVPVAPAIIEGGGTPRPKPPVVPVPLVLGKGESGGALPIPIEITPPKETLIPPSETPQLPVLPVVEKPMPDEKPIPMPKVVKEPEKPEPSKPLRKEKEKETLTLGAGIEFHRKLEPALEKARQDKKVVMLVHIAGSVENERFTCANAETLRTQVFADLEVATAVREHCVAACARVGKLRKEGDIQLGGVVTYFLLPDGWVVHAIPGTADASTFLAEIKWMVEARKAALKESQGGEMRTYSASIRKAHSNQYFNDSTPAMPGFAGPLQIQGFIPGIGFVGGGGPFFPGMIGPPQQFGPRRLPEKRPTELSAMAQTHWLLARQSPFYKLDALSKIMYEGVLREKLLP